VRSGQRQHLTRLGTATAWEQILVGHLELGKRSGLGSPRAGAKRRAHLSFGARKALAAHLFVLPAVVFFLIWYIYPIGKAVWISFHNWNIMRPPVWAGLQNYQLLIQDKDFLTSLGKTGYYMVGMPVTVSLALLLALIMNSRLPARGFFRTIYFLPVVTSSLVTSLVWKWVYDPHFGLIAGVTRRLGLGAIPWLTSTDWAMPALIIYGVWGGLGYVMVLFLAGLQSIPPEYYEASGIDGAGKWQQFRYVTLPLLRPVLLFVLITQMIGAAQMFTPAYAMTRGGPVGATRVVSLLIYQTGFEYLKMGYASTMALAMFVIMIVAAILQMRLVGRRAY
jgi:ABC-type sugar transport system permease subunit